MQSSDVIVIGAGVGGLAAALSLLRAGQKVRLYEQVYSLGEVGAGLTITPNAGKALLYLGLGDALRAMGSTPPAGVMRHFSSGKILLHMPQDKSEEKYGVPLYHVHRADLHNALRSAVDALDPTCIRTGMALESLDSRTDGVRLRLQGGQETTADWLVAADGIHSRARSELFGSDKPNFTGYVAWRGLIPGELVAPDLMNPPLCMTVGPRRMLMRYPLRRGSVVNFVAVAQRTTWTAEGWSVRSELSELMAEFHDFEPHTKKLLELTPPDRLFKWGLFDRDPMPTWIHGSTILIGDAAHAMPPFTGQGAVMALEDGAVIGRAALLSSTPAEAIHRFEKSRYARVNAALAMSRGRAELYFSEDPLQQVRGMGLSMAELRTTYDYDSGNVRI